MPFNDDIAERLERLSKLHELLGENRFKCIALSKAARVIEQHPVDLRPMAADRAALTAIEGIGGGIAEKIAEFARTGAIAELEETQAKVPRGVLTLMEIPGLGPKTVRAMWQELGIVDRAGLIAALDSGAILQLPRMGQKAADKIRENLSFLADSAVRLHRGVALAVAEGLLGRVAAVPGVERAAYAGSLRRGVETVGDVDLLAVAEDPAAAHAALTGAASVRQVIGSGGTKSSVRVALPELGGRWKGFTGQSASTVQVDLRVVPRASWGAALMYFTGSKAHNVRLRERAQSMGLSLNEYGLTRDGAPVADASTEPALFDALGLPYIPPELREDLGELGLDRTPDLIEASHIRAELHAHTTASDGRLSLEQLAERAIARGLHTLAVTDHSQSSAQAGGLTPDRLAQQRREIEALRERLGDRLDILCGSEVDILADGSLDFDQDVLDSLDFVVASPHAALDQDPARATARLLRAIENPAVRVLGHPTGRIIGKRRGLEPAMAEIIAAAAERGVALEINSHWLRLDLRDHHARAAVRAGALIAIDCDVHAPDDFEHIVHGVATARRAGLTPSGCVNAWDRDRLRAWIKRRP